MTVCLLYRPVALKIYSTEKIQSFDDLIRLVWSQGSIFHTTAGLHPEKEARCHKINLYMGQIQKLLQIFDNIEVQCCQKS